MYNSIIKFTPKIGKIYPKGVSLPPVENPCSSLLHGFVSETTDLVATNNVTITIAIVSSQCFVVLVVASDAIPSVFPLDLMFLHFI